MEEVETFHFSSTPPPIPPPVYPTSSSPKRISLPSWTPLVYRSFIAIILVSYLWQDHTLHTALERYNDAVTWRVTVAIKYGLLSTVFSRGWLVVTEG